MTAWGEEVGDTILLSIGIMITGIAAGMLALVVGAILRKLTGRDNAITRWMDH